MNLNLKGIIQNLDGHIAVVTAARDLLVRALTVEGGSTISGMPFQTSERSTTDLRTIGEVIKDNEALARGEMPPSEVARQARADKAVRARGTKKKKRGGRSVQAEPKVAKPAGGTAEPALTPGGFKPSTLSGAMKLEIAPLKEFTLEYLQNVVDGKYRGEEFHKNAAANSFYGNLSYWAKTGRLEKTGDGATAVFKVLDKEFFSMVGM